MRTRAGLDAGGPADDGRFADTAFVKRTFEAFEAAGGVEVFRVDAAGVVRGAVVAGEDDDRVIRHAGFLEGGEDAADFLVEARDHRGVSGARGAVGAVAAFLRGVGGGLGDDALILFQLFGRDLQGHVRQRRGVVEEEGLVLVGRDERFGARDRAFAQEVFADERRVGLGVLRVGASREDAVAGCAVGAVVERHLLAVILDEGRVVAVRDPLAGHAEEAIEALLQRTAGGLETAHAPFAERGGRIAGLLERRGQSLDAGRQRELLAVADVAVVAGRGVAGVATGHEYRARGGADRVAAVVSGEDHPFTRQAIHVGRTDDLLAVVADFAVAEVVGQDEDDVRAGLRAEGGGQEGKQEQGGAAHALFLGLALGSVEKPRGWVCRIDIPAGLGLNPIFPLSGCSVVW